MQTNHIHITGRVQGVGFRPFVFRLAEKWNIKGSVANTHNGVHIYAQGSDSACEAFLKDILSQPPQQALVEDSRLAVLNLPPFEDFRIVESECGEKPDLHVTPDLAMCSECRNELHEPENKRFAYAFGTCTHCGPRFSITQNLPFDRKNTAMHPFDMCESCYHEYKDPNNRRFYSQTNSCAQCGVSLYWLKGGDSNENPISHLIGLLNQGKIVAVKGIGGFLLLADATQHSVVSALRARKHRLYKPFAVLFPDLTSIEQVAHISPDEKQALVSSQSPIVLLRFKNADNLAMEAIAPGLNRIGAMLPYAPLLDLIATGFGRPLVATSANVSGSPIIYRDEDALAGLDGIADAILSNNREIVFPQDDAVVMFTPAHRQQIILRRSRGYAPGVDLPKNSFPEGFLAFGAEMKSAFALTTSGRTYLSQFLGDTGQFESQQSFEAVLHQLLHMLKPDTKHVLADLHPNYFTAQLAKQWAAANDFQFTRVQHHEAHLAAVLAENNLIHAEEPVLGIIWDGTGYGTDGQIWGSELFLYKNHKINRLAHLKPFVNLFNNRMAHDPRLAAASILWPSPQAKTWLAQHFQEAEQHFIRRALQEEALLSTSMGRLFDAAMSVIDPDMRNTYEGQAALQLQVLAEKCTHTAYDPFPVEIENNLLNGGALLRQMIIAQQIGMPPAQIALRFHHTLIAWVKNIADHAKTRNIAFSGGVFQNALLADVMIDVLAPGYNLFFHKQMPPNDENIAFGQMACLAMLINRTSKQTKNTELCA